MESSFFAFFFLNSLKKKNVFMLFVSNVLCFKIWLLMMRDLADEKIDEPENDICLSGITLFVHSLHGRELQLT